MRALLIISVVCLALGLGLIFWFCNGSTSFDFAYPIAGTKLHLDIATTGGPALAGVLLTMIDALLLAFIWVIALARPLGPRMPVESRDDVKRREEPFVQ